LERFGSFRIGMVALVAIGFPAAGVAARPAAAAPEDPGLEELWEQFPLDAERDAPAPSERSSDDAGTKAEPAQRVAPKSVPQPGGADSTFGTAAQLAIVAAGITLLLLGGFAVVYTGHVPSPPRVRMPARPFVRGWRPAQAAAVAAADWVRSARAALPTSRSASFPATDPPLTGRRVVDDLLRVVSAAPPQRKPVEEKMPRKTEAPDHAWEIQALKAKPRVAEPLKYSMAGPHAGADALKRKPPVDATEALKAKGESEGVLDKQRLARSDAVALKEKLASLVEHEQAAKRRENPARTRPRRAGPKRQSALRPVPDPDIETRTEARQARVTQECEVRWWRGFVRSQFLAVATDAGAEDTVALSPYFRWHKSEPPPETPAAAAALRALVGSLEHEGWQVVGRGEDWFAVRLAAGRRVDRTGLADRSESRT
jgi:hypothetical protein